jgi:sugar phosphate isomerase/epimerase
VKFRSGLVSVTFRQRSPGEIIDLCKQANVSGIEWGGDIHVPHGKLDIAKDVRKATEKAKIEVAAYGSYYRAGAGQDAFEPVLETATELGAPMIRIWCGAKGSTETYAAGRHAIEEDLKRICDLAAKAKKIITCEWHGGTLTDTAESAKSLFDAVDHPALKTFWQPRAHAARDFCLRDMDVALPRLAALHVFNWHPQSAERLPLADGADDWAAYLEKAATASGKNEMFALIEFVREEKPAQFVKDAEALNSWLSKMS